MQKLFALDRLAPELRDSPRQRLLVGVAAALVLALALGGTGLGFYLDNSGPGISQSGFHSTERFLTAPGGRVVYYPEKRTAIVKGWFMPPLKGSGIYQVWALRGGEYQSIGMGDSLDFVGFTLTLKVDLNGVEQIIFTREPAVGSLAGPAGPTIVTLVPDL